MITKVLQRFDELAKTRFVDPWSPLRAIAEFGRDAIETLEEKCTRHALRWDGHGDKQFVVFSPPDEPLTFSRAMNIGLYIADPNSFVDRWAALLAALEESAGEGRLKGIDAAEVDRLFHTAVVGFGAGLDVYSGGNRKAPGTFLEMAVGPTLAVLSGRPERGQIRLKDVETGDVEEIPVDLHFAPTDAEAGATTLVVATKISTRERISQAYVHQRFLDVLRPGEFRSILIACNENNVRRDKGTPKAKRTHENCWLTDTLVPGTIKKYQRFIAELDGLYYTDPPVSYAAGKHDGLPEVRSFGELLTQDLPNLLKA